MLVTVDRRGRCRRCPATQIADEGGDRAGDEKEHQDQRHNKVGCVTRALNADLTRAIEARRAAPVAEFKATRARVGLRARPDANLCARPDTVRTIPAGLHLDIVPNIAVNSMSWARQTLCLPLVRLHRKGRAWLTHLPEVQVIANAKGDERVVDLPLSLGARHALAKRRRLVRWRRWRRLRWGRRLWWKERWRRRRPRAAEFRDENTHIVKMGAVTAT
eukprot:7324737-Prymnesium_polylepis.2